MMYAEIASNKRKTFLVIALFVAIVTFVFFLIGLSIDSNSYSRYGSSSSSMTYIMTCIGLLISIAFSLNGYYRGGSTIMSIAKARPVNKESETYLVNLVEGISLSAGIPPPEVRVIDSPIPNAFATGRDYDHSIVAVTTGLMNMMNKEELEGVIAHEISHVKNYDIRYASLVASLAVLLFVISRVALYGGLFSGNGRRSRDDDRNGGLQILQLLGILLAIFSPIIAYALQSLMSRKREFLADATAASLLGYPLGLASALEKLSNYYKGAAKKGSSQGMYTDDESEYENYASRTKWRPPSQDSTFSNRAISALCIVNPLTSASFDNIFNTHPSTEERIKRLRNM